MSEVRGEVSTLRAKPSHFFAAQTPRLLQGGGPVLDLACGLGRHALAAAALGLDVVALDRNRDSLDSLHKAAEAIDAPGSVSVLQADLESDSFPPLLNKGFAAVLVFRYLHRPLAPWIESVLRPGGLLIYETFTTGQRSLGWGPKRDDFLLRAGELPQLFPGLENLVFEEGLSGDEEPAETARLVARRPG